MIFNNKYYLLTKNSQTAPFLKSSYTTKSRMETKNDKLSRVIITTNKENIKGILSFHWYSDNTTRASKSTLLAMIGIISFSWYHIV